MKLLLDTHIWLWSMLAPERLSRRVTTELQSATNELWLSPISVWEAALLGEKGRVEFDDDPRAWINRALQKVAFKEAPLTREVALQSRAVDLSHQDPVDRFLAATARVLALTLVTADRRLLRGKTFRTLANR
ncbi:MAG TPA: type II toxin-antitoxin system VapC family toxin [Candidatus Binatia bacterium]|nr:type II toxin-antitoxin system VapC family toxin [Candidatus Binatia bacterium]